MERPATREAAQAHINQIRKAKGFDAEPGSSSTSSITDDLEASLSILSEGLYQQSTRFLMELIQNADDCLYHCQVPTMEINYWNGRLRVDYNEVGFTMRDVEAICRISSTKKASTDQTGEKGIGFKSLFRIADVVSVASGHYSFQFDARRRLGMITPEWSDFPASTRPGFTSILLRIRSTDAAEELVQDLKSTSAKLLLFLRRLRLINISIDVKDGTTWGTSLSRVDKDIQAGSYRTTKLIHDGHVLDYLIYQHVVKELPRDPRRAHCHQSRIMLAFPIRIIEGIRAEPVVESQQIYAVLPIRDYGLKASKP